ITALVDQLKHPWTSNKLIRVLRNNLRPEIRHEILNIQFHGYARSTPFRREVSEFGQEYEGQIDSEPETDGDVEAFSLMCWNCRKEGRRYQDCVSERRVFCYGCGAANTYKPSCSKCSKNSKAGMSKSQFRQKTSSASRNQATMTE
ncbi:hypothetical protein KR200_010607, partial [Drosophila serrata]